jgi:hypothetical protein
MQNRPLQRMHSFNERHYHPSEPFLLKYLAERNVVTITTFAL